MEKREGGVPCLDTVLVFVAVVEEVKEVGVGGEAGKEGER